MNNNDIYEIGFLINPDLAQQGADKTVENVKNILNKSSASVISEGEIVDIDLAYEITTKIASKNVRFEKAFFTWVKFESEKSQIEVIKKEIDKIKAEVFRFLIVKTTRDDEETDKFLTSEDEEEPEKESEDKDISDKEVNKEKVKTEELEEEVKEEK